MVFDDNRKIDDLSIKSNNRYVREITKIEVFVQTMGPPWRSKNRCFGGPKIPPPRGPPEKGGVAVILNNSNCGGFHRDWTPPR